MPVRSRTVAFLVPLLLAAVSLRPCLADDLHVAAAADLERAFTQAASTFERRTGQHVVLTFASSGLIVRQVENGAPYDLFAAANQDYIARLDREGLTVPGTSAPYALGRIGVWTPDPSAPLHRLEDLRGTRWAYVAIANPDVAPYGRAAEQALRASGIWDSLRPRLVYGGNIEETMRFVTSGNAQAGILARALVIGRGGRFLPISQRRYRPLVQSLAIIKASKRRGAAEQFSAFIRGSAGQGILARYDLALPKPARGLGR